MGGCGVLVILFICIPLGFVLLFLLAGGIVGSVGSLIASTIAFIALKRKGVFDKPYEEKWQLTAVKVAKILLIVIMIASAIVLAVCIWFLAQNV